MARLTSQGTDDLRSPLSEGEPAEIAERVRSMPSTDIASLLAGMHPADSADVFEELRPEQQRDVLSTMAEASAAGVLAFLDEGTQGAVAAQLPPEKLGPILDEMAPDDAADVLAELPQGQASAALSRMAESGDAGSDSRSALHRSAIEKLLAYDEETAGGLMTPHAVTLREGATVAQALAVLRRLHPSEELTYYLYVTDHAGRLRGVVSLRQLVTAEPSTRVGAIMNAKVISVPAAADREEAAHVLTHYGLLALPTVDEEGRLVGVITADDVIGVIQEEATEDLYHLAGLDAAERMDESVLTTSRRRLQWLLINLPTALLAGMVVNRFEGTVQKVAALAVFMPIIAGMGGNAGIQTLTLIVRSMALGEIPLKDGWRILGRELLVGLINGVCFGLVLGVIGWLWKGLPWLGVITGTAMLANMLAAALAGTVVPLLLKRVGADPALASGVLVTTITDVTGYGCFLGTSSLLLHHLLR